MNTSAIGAYSSATKLGWSAYDKEGRTWEVSAQDAEKIEALRTQKKTKPAS